MMNQKRVHKKPTGHVYEDALKLCCISISTAVIHRSVFDSLGGFDENFFACEDYDFWLRATQRFEVKLIPEVHTIKDGGRPDQLSMQWGLDRFRIDSLRKMLAGGELNSEDYDATFDEMWKKGQVYIKGAQKRGRLKEINLNRPLPYKS